MDLRGIERVAVLGGEEYVSRVRAAFAATSLEVAAPLSGLRIGEMMQRVRRALEEGRPL